MMLPRTIIRLQTTCVKVVMFHLPKNLHFVGIHRYNI